MLTSFNHTKRPIRGRIRPQKRPNTAHSFTDQWKILADAIRAVIEHHPCPSPFVALHGTCHGLVNNNAGEPLYFHAQHHVAQHFERLREQEIVHQRGAPLLLTLSRLWPEIQLIAVMVKDILLYLNDTWVTPRKNEGCLPIYQLVMSLFLKHLLLHEPIPPPTLTLHGPNSVRAPTTALPLENTTLQSVVHAVMEQIAEERDGNLTDRTALKVVVQMLTELGDLPKKTNTPTTLLSIYNDIFLPQVINATEQHYDRFGDACLQSHMTVAPYMQRVATCLKEEKERCVHYLVYLLPEEAMLGDKGINASPMWQGIERVICTTMLDAKKVESLFEDPTWHQLYEEGRLTSTETTMNSTHTSLQTIWQVVYLANRQEILIKSVQSYVEKTGEHLQTTLQAANPVSEGGKKPNMTALALKWAGSLLELRKTCDALSALCFENDKALRDAINAGFVAFLAKEARAAEWISLYIDEYLKKGSKGQSDEETEKVLDLIILLFRSLGEKDVFENYYKQHLANRLLQGRSVSDDLEKAMVHKLKSECGVQYTAKIETMFKDTRSSGEIVAAYKKHIKGAQKYQGLELNVRVLTPTSWPLSTWTGRGDAKDAPVSGVFAAELTAHLDSFKQFYLTKHNGRVLSWQPQLGDADVKCHLGKDHDINMSTHQMMVLLLFNKTTHLDYQQIQAATGINQKDLVRTLVSLSNGRFILLKKTPSAKSIQPTDTFDLNLQFQNQSYRIKLPTVTMTNKAEDDAEVKETQAKLDDERKNVMEAAIVRIMKSRKHLSHQQLIIEVVNMLSDRFKPNIPAIKSRIESLLERDYLSRAATATAAYDYVA